MRRALGLGVLCATLAGCTVGPTFRPPSILSRPQSAPDLLGAREAAFASAPLPHDWWRLYDDPRLDALEQKALVHNTDLRVALADLQQAQALLQQARALRTPSTNFTSEATYGQISADSLGLASVPPPGPFYALTEGVSYDLDLFGRLRRGVEAAKASVGAARAALDLARVNVAAETAQAYAGVCSAGLRIAVTSRSLAVARQSLYVTQRRFQAGIAPVTDVVRASTLVRQTQAELPALYAQRRSDLYLIATLTGDPPEQLPTAVAGCATPPVIRRPIPVGSGADLIARRPDVREAERTLHARVAAIGETTADLFPTITLGGSIGTEAASAADIVSSRGFTWNVGPMVSWTFPNTSVVRARIAQSNAAAREALAQFDGSVLTSLRETETAMVSLARQLDNEQDLSLARDDAERAAHDTARLYAGGVGQFIDTLDAERTAIEAEDALAQSTAAVSQDQIGLFMALGGGWEDAPGVEDIGLQAVTAPRKSRSSGKP